MTFSVGARVQYNHSHRMWSHLHHHQGTIRALDPDDRRRVFVDWDDDAFIAATSQSKNTRWTIDVLKVVSQEYSPEQSGDTAEDI